MAATYSEEFKQEVVRLRRESGKSYRELGGELGVSPFSIRKWVNAAPAAAGEAASIGEREELRKLRREVGFDPVVWTPHDGLWAPRSVS
jgi:transposase-like protein